MQGFVDAAGIEQAAEIGQGDRAAARQFFELIVGVLSARAAQNNLVRLGQQLRFALQFGAAGRRVEFDPS